MAEGLAAGALLTCVAAAMIPEAIHLGGEGAGFVLGTYAQPRRKPRRPPFAKRASGTWKHAALLRARVCRRSAEERRQLCPLQLPVSFDIRALASSRGVS